MTAAIEIALEYTTRVRGAGDVTPATPVEIALDYAARFAWPLFPVSWDGKKYPLIKQWPERATTDPATITELWRRWPKAFVGVPTGKRSNTIVVDIDCKDNRNGFQTLADYYQLYDFPETCPQVFTRSGGRHVYFAVNPNVVIINSAGRYGLGPGLDIRGQGGFVVVPCPGSGYSWHSKFNFQTIPRSDVPAAPAWLNHRQRKPSNPRDRSGRRLNPQAILDEACRRIRTAPKGERHDTYRHETFRIALLVGSGALSESEARHALETEVMALGLAADGHWKRVEKYYNAAFSEGLAASRGRARR